LPPGADFATLFARGLWTRMAGARPHSVARATVMVNTRRGLRAIEDALLAAAGGSALLPRMALLSELGEDPLAARDLPPAIDPLRRQLRLTRLVEDYLRRAEGARVNAAPDLSEALGALLDELQENGIDAAALDGLVAGELPEQVAAHWQNTLKFVDIARKAWPEIRAEAEGGALDPKARQRLVIERLVAEWQTAPPADPVLAAGSTGSVASTADLLAAVARLPQGAVVLPGFDPDIAPEVWQELGPEHPMAPFKGLLQRLEMQPADVLPWTGMPETARLRLLVQALRPAPVTDAWQRAAPALAAEAEAATAGLTLVEAPTLRHEAAAIALAMRRALEAPAVRVALITPDASLARRVTAELDRFGVLPDDSLGQPLAQSPAGVFLRHVAEVALGAAPVRLAALLQHPLARPGIVRGRHLELARRYELEVLRQRPQPGLPPGRLPEWKPSPEGAFPRIAPTDEGLDWLARIEAILAELAAPLTGDAPLAEVVAAHIAAAEALSRESGEAAPEVWQQEAGARLHEVMQRLARNADAHGDGAAEGYLTLLGNLLGRESLPPEAERPHPRVMIWGTQEARIQGADLVILGGLNEGVWPAPPPPDPWLSRPMRETLGLPSQDLRIGLSAHDFLQGAARGQVILTRSRKLEGAPTVASRWLIRLENLMGGLDEGAALAAMRGRGQELLDLVALVHQPEMPVNRAPRPEPRPPVAARPRKLSVTQIETLIRDAYAIYAYKVLGLRPLDPLGRPANTRERGMVIHKIMERFARDTIGGLPPPDRARALLLEAADAVLAEDVPWPDTRRIWRARLARAADWFLTGEAARREAGRPEGLEVKGALPMAAPAGEFTLTARADRIDLLATGDAAIIDYKAGAPPSKDQIDTGFNQQLHLQAAILMAGGFEGLDALETRAGMFLGLTGSGNGGVERRVDDLPETLAAHMARLEILIAAYDRAETGYISRGRAEKQAFEGDYDHLARRGEWDGGGLE
ncbi:MAG TPA: double-strand break repair protein AddB, partial [Thermohalobaculum sp.]|nr:double-strand break repair protein AddB [Thermohalobaculum sp.]